MSRDPAVGLYLHIPFCLAKCRYCAFNSRPLVDPRIAAAYVGALVRELRTLGAVESRRLSTIYFGGGTPTILRTPQLARLLTTVREGLRMDAGAEVTIEANPGTIDRARAERLLALGFNRLSLGIQALRDDLLAGLGRVHDAAQALAAFRAVRRAGFRNVSADLIFGLPGQTLDGWRADLGRLLELGPEHLSLYALALEPGTPLARAAARGSVAVADDDLVVAMYEATLELTAAAGFEHYEISSYARPGFRSRHNGLYWNGDDYHGVGAGAHSFLRGRSPVRWANVVTVEAYLARTRGGRALRGRVQRLDERAWRAEGLMLGLRRMEGVSLREYRRRFGVDPLDCFGAELAGALGIGWLERDAGRLRLTAEGILFSDEVFRQLF